MEKGGETKAQEFGNGTGSGVSGVGWSIGDVASIMCMHTLYVKFLFGSVRQMGNAGMYQFADG